MLATIGTFDGVHLGHQYLFEQGASIALRHRQQLIAVTFNQHPLQVINPQAVPQLLMPLSERNELLRDLPTLQGVELLDFDKRLRSATAEQFMRYLHQQLHVDNLVLGYDHSFGSDRPATLDDYRRIGHAVGMGIWRAEPYKLPATAVTVSSSAIRRYLAQGKLLLANAMLGRQFALTGQVVAGRQKGRTIGYPTANVSVDPALMLPARGVYAAWASTADGAVHQAMVNIGTCPTVAGPDANNVTVEAHLIGWTGELYGNTLRLQFVQRLRDERPFARLDDLRTQLDRDKASAQAALQSK